MHVDDVSFVATLFLDVLENKIYNLSVLILSTLVSV